MNTAHAPCLAANLNIREQIICYHDYCEPRSESRGDKHGLGLYPNYDDIARFEYGRMFWRSASMRARLLRHWTDDRHPYHDRFANQRALIEEVLQSEEPPEELDENLRERGTSLRCVVREIPPVFGSFF